MSMTDAQLDAMLKSLPLRQGEVVRVCRASPRVSRLWVRIATSYVEGGWVPGQFVALAASGVPPKFFAIANRSEGDPVLEFLIAGGTLTSDALCALQPGAPIDVSSIQGSGYALARFADQPVVILAAGTGIAAIRPLVQTLLSERTPAAVAVYYGYASFAERQFGEDLLRWRQAGARVIEVEDGVGSPRRYVQHAFAHDVAVGALDAWAWSAVGDGRFSVSDAHYVICGPDAMQKASVATLRSRGIGASRMHFNY